MLTHIVDPRFFDICIEAIKHAYYPYDECFNRKQLSTFDDLEQCKWYIKDILPGWQENPSDNGKIKQIRDKINKSADTQASAKNFYLVFNRRDSDSFRESLKLPFVNHFHKWFLLREWDEPYRDPKQEIENLLRLHPPEDPPKDVRDNHSKNHGNFNHFVNVVAALARLIWYFRDPQTVQDSLFGQDRIEDRESLCKTIAYGDGSSSKIYTPRTFKLMLGAFYHDIGKTIIASRHAMEGAIILASHTTSGRYQFAEILKAYNDIPAFANEQFNWDDLLMVADFVLYHDQYGTLSTGEDSYLQLAEIIDKLSRHSLNADNQKRMSQKYLFDLWLLNIADIMVSLKDKPKLQNDWWGNQNSAQKKIQAFFNTDKSVDLIHDLKISFNLLDNYLNKKHISSLISSGEDAHAISVRHAIERLRRLIVTSLEKAVKEFKNNDQLSYIVGTIPTLSEKEWNLMIVHAIESIADRNEYCNRFSWIGKSDYALGFFTKLAKAALEAVAREIAGTGSSTGWIYRKVTNKQNEEVDENYLKTNNAQLFATNYVAIVIQIIEHLIFREPSLDRPRNLEFSDATERLQDDKISQILGFEGPFRSRYSTRLILQTIYLY